MNSQSFYIFNIIFCNVDTGIDVKLEFVKILTFEIFLLACS